MPLTNIVSGVMPGTVAYFAAASNPGGFLECNGAAISRTAYAALFTAIGTAYGAGDGSTTFNVPDLRGEFIRGHDNGRGIDSGRAIGSTQAQRNDHLHVTGNLSTGPTAVACLESNSGELRPRNMAMRPCIKF